MRPSIKRIKANKPLVSAGVIPPEYFGMHILGPTETNIRGEGVRLEWPPWSPNAYRVLDVFGYIPADGYNDSVMSWGGVETSEGSFNWALFDSVFAKLKAEGVTDLCFAFNWIPRWAQLGNPYTHNCTISAASPGLVTLTSNKNATTCDLTGAGLYNATRNTSQSDPAGGNNAIRLNDTAVLARHGYDCPLVDNPWGPDDWRYCCLNVYVKAAGRRITVGIYGDDDNGVIAVFDVAGAQVGVNTWQTSYWVGPASGLQDARLSTDAIATGGGGNGWYIATLTFMSMPTAKYKVFFTLDNATGTNPWSYNYVGDGSGVYLYAPRICPCYHNAKGGFHGGTVPGNVSLDTTDYWVKSRTGDTFTLSATQNGTDINTTGSLGTTSFTLAETRPADWSKLANWVTQYLTRAKEQGIAVKFVESINEPNNGHPFWVGSSHDLVDMQRTIYNAAKAFDSSIKVVSAPPNSIGMNYPNAPPYAEADLAGGIFGHTGLGEINQFLKLGGGNYCDIIGYHGYPTASDPEEMFTDRIPQLKRIMKRYGVNKPLWNTEYASGTGVVATNATKLAVTSLLSWSYGVERQYYYAYDNSSTEKLWDDTLSGGSGALNAAGIAYRCVHDWMCGAQVSEPPSKSGQVWSVGLKRPGYQARAVWTQDGSTPNYTKPSWATQYRKLDTTIVTGLGSTVTLGRDPILLEGGTMPYRAKAVHFPYPTYLSCASLTNTDNSYWSFSFWMRHAGVPGTAFNAIIFVCDPTNGYSHGMGSFNNTDGFGWFWGGAGSGSANLGIANLGGGLNTCKWSHVLVSIDSNAASNYIVVYINDKRITSFNALSHPATGTPIAFNGRPFLFGGDSYGSANSGTEFADVWVAPGQTLISGGDIPLATRRKFISPEGKPVYLGSTGQTPTGTTPRIFFSNAAASFNTNLGSGGTFSVAAGGVTDSDNSPSDY